MKKTTKILSVFLALLMVCTCIPMTAFAAERDTSSLSAYLDNDNLANVAETLLTDLGDRKEDLVPTVLNLVFQLVPDLKTRAEAKGINVFAADTEDLASVLLDYVDEVLEEADLNSQLPSAVVSAVKIIGISNLDFSSVDSILGVIVDLGGVVGGKTSTWGDLANLDVSPLTTTANRKTVAISRANSSATDILYGLFDFISASKNVAIIKKVIKGELSVGNMNKTIAGFGFDIEETVNGLMSNLPALINEQIYNGLLAEKETVENEDGTTSEVIKVAYADSAYTDFNSDELLAAALIKVISGKEATLTEAQEVASMTLYDLIGKYADGLIAQYAIEPLNTTVKDALKQLCDSDPQLAVLKDILNLDYEFTADTFNFAQMTQDGLFENLNDIVCTIIEVLVQPSVYTELGLKKGGNENITANLTSFFGFVLKTLAGNNGGKLEFTIDGVQYSYDFSQFTQENLANKSLEDMVVAVIGLFYPTLLNVEVPADVDTLEKLAAYTANLASEKFMVNNTDVSGFDRDYTDIVFDADGTVKDLTAEDAVNVIGTIGMDVAIYWLNRATNIGVDQAKVTELKAAGWTWEDFFEEIVDWALNYIDGIPAVADVLETEQGVKDGYGAWYKLNVVLNELVPLAFVNGCGDETFTFDLYTFVMEKVAPSILDCDFAAFADILSKNDNPDNPFNQPLIASTISLVDNLLFSLLEHTCGATKEFTKAATATREGYTGTYDSANGHYLTVEVLPATGTVDPEPPVNNPDDNEDPKPPVEDPSDNEEPVEPAFILGDVDGDGEVTAADARLALRAAAKLEVLSDTALKAADIDGDGNATAAEARLILRVAAKLDVFA